VNNETPKISRIERRGRRTDRSKPKPWPPRRLPSWRMPTGVKPLPGQASLFPEVVPDVPGPDDATVEAHEAVS